MKSIVFFIITLFILESCSSSNGKKIDREYFSSETNQFVKSESKVISGNNSILDKISYLCFQRKFGKADILIESFYLKNKKKPDYWNHIGNCFFYKRDYVKAELFFNKAIDISSSFAPAWNNLGLISLKKNQRDDAVSHFKKALNYNPNLILARYNLAQIYNAWGLGSESLKVLNPIASYEANNPYFTSNLAYAHYLNKQYNKSIELYERAERSFLSREGWRVFYPLALFRAGKIKEAKQWLDSLSISSRNKDYLEFTRLKRNIEQRVSNGSV